MNKITILQARNVHRIYNNGFKRLHVLKGINLIIEKGTILAIVGPSGAGKSTFLHLLGGLDRPTEGEVILEELNLAQLSDSQLSAIRNKNIGFIFQFYHLLAEFTALENVMLPALIDSKSTPDSRSKIKEVAYALLKKVGLDNRIDHRPSQLSGGEQQRVAIARALMNNPQILLCDEPTGNLDSNSGEEIFSILKELNRDNDTTVVIVTHSEDIAGFADRVVHLKDGALVA